MKIKKPIACGLIGALSLLGCTDSNENKPREEISQSVTEEKPDWVYQETSDGFSVEGTLDDIKFQYSGYSHLSGYQKSFVKLTMTKRNGPVILTVDLLDGHWRGELDGNVNMVSTPLRKFHYNDDGTLVYSPKDHEKNAQKLREWANTKLKKIQDLLKEEFGDKVKITPEQIKNDTIEDYLKNFEFEREGGEEGNFEFERMGNFLVLRGEVDGVNVNYLIHDLNGVDSIDLTLTKNGKYIGLRDDKWSDDHKVDGNINAVTTSFETFYYHDNGDIRNYPEKISVEDAKKLITWANEKFAFVQKELKERFWDKVEIDEPETIDELLEDFDF